MTEHEDSALARSRRQGLIALVIVQFCFGLFPIFGKYAMSGASGEVFSPRALAAWRMLVGALVLGLVALWRHGPLMRVSGQDLWRLQLCAFLGISVNQVLYLEGLLLAPATNAALIMCLIPVLTLLVAVLFRQENASKLKFLGTAIAFAGTAQLVLARGLDLSDDYLRGNLLMCANAASYSVYLVYVRKLTHRLPPFVVIAWVFLLSLWQIPLFIGDAALVPREVSPKALGGLAFVLAFPTILAYFLNTFALVRVSSSTTAFFIFSQPVIAACGAYLAWRESVGWPALLAALAIFIGMRLAVIRPRPKL